MGDGVSPVRVFPARTGPLYKKYGSECDGKLRGDGDFADGRVAVPPEEIRSEDRRFERESKIFVEASPGARKAAPFLE
jgi:hypothetical protein